MLEAVYLVLDIILASVVAALLLRFRNADAVARAAEGIRAHHRRFALGAAVLAGAGVLLIPGTILRGVASHEALTATTLGAYALALTGILLIASTTWRPRAARRRPAPGQEAEL